jgi:hypothetical protein
MLLGLPAQQAFAASAAELFWRLGTHRRIALAVSRQPASRWLC